MLDKDTRTAILALSREGYGPRRIAEDLGVSRNSVRRVLRSGMTEPAARLRGSILDGHLEDIRRFFAECNGNLVRVREKLLEALAKRGQEAEVSYSTLTWLCRQHGIGVEEPVPVCRIVTEPGEEMQHDTSPMKVILGGKRVLRHCASLVLGYSRMLYAQFYPRFQRFHMKVFLTDAFKYLGGCCRRCVIDNTSIAIACGTGRQAQVAPEVEAFERRFGFEFAAHELGHKERSGKVERPFGYIQGNFLAGRSFKDDEDLNRQALQWLENANRRRLRDLKASPLELFAAEKPHLAPLPLYVPEVYRTFQRVVDVYGCVSVERMKYPAPAAYIGKIVLVREAKDQVRLFDGHKELAAHKKKVEGSPSPEASPPLAPRRQRLPRLPEEERLKAVGETTRRYLELLKAQRPSRYVWSVKRLYRLLCQYDAQVLERAVARAAEHRLFDVGRIEAVMLQDIAQREYRLPLDPGPEDYQNWPQYRQGASTPEPDLKSYAPEAAQEPNDDP